MAIQFLDGAVLVRGGSVATHADCCCTPSCFPDPCAIPSCDYCTKCWEQACAACNTFTELEVSISGVGNALQCPPGFDIGDCCYNFDGCKCNQFNSTFIHEFSNNRDCLSGWNLTANYPYDWDTCGTPQTFQCNALQIKKNVTVIVRVASQEYTYTSGGLKYISLPCGYYEYGYVCNNYTLSPGHYVIVILKSVVSSWGNNLYTDQKWFLYSFANGVKFDPDCPDDQYYPTCDLTGGTATLLLTQRVYNPTNTFYADCNDWDYGCQLSDAVVTVEVPVYTPCEETEDPPPP